MNKYIKFLVAILLLPILTKAQSTNIEISIKDYPDDEVYIAYYYGKYQYILDTLKLDPQKGIFTISDDSLLQQGMYILATKNKNWFEFIIDEDQEFSLNTHIDDMVINMDVKGHQENNWFFTFLQDQHNMRQMSDSLKQVRTGLTDNNKILEIEETISTLNTRISNYQTEFINTQPKSFVAKIFNASREPIVPEELTKDTTSDAAYQYFIQNFWNDFDLTDNRMVYSPLMFKKMDRFFNTLLMQVPDTLIDWSKWFIAQTKPDKDMYKFAIWYLTNTMQTSNIMGHDAVFVYLVNNYYKTGEAYWATPSVIKSISESADQLSRVLIGSQAPDLVMTDTSGAFVTLHKIEADYTILYFWDTDCGHCLTETPKLKEIYDQVRNQGVEVFAVQIEQDDVNWKKQIIDKNLDWINATDAKNWNNLKSTFAISATPMVYVLDKDKKIIYKKIAVFQLWEILEREGLKLEKPQETESEEGIH